MGTTPKTPAQFVSTRPGVEAVVMRIGLHTTQVVFVAESGEWLRFVVSSPEEALALCETVNVKPHDGYPDHLLQRIASYRRSPEDWAAAPYPERTSGSSA